MQISGRGRYQSIPLGHHITITSTMLKRPPIDELGGFIISSNSQHIIIPCIRLSKHTQLFYVCLGAEGAYEWQLKTVWPKNMRWARQGEGPKNMRWADDSLWNGKVWAPALPGGGLPHHQLLSLGTSASIILSCFICSLYNLLGRMWPCSKILLENL